MPRENSYFEEEVRGAIRLYIFYRVIGIVAPAVALPVFFIVSLRSPDAGFWMMVGGAALFALLILYAVLTLVVAAIRSLWGALFPPRYRSYAPAEARSSHRVRREPYL